MAKIETFLSLIGLFTTLCSPYVSTEPVFDEDGDTFAPSAQRALKEGRAPARLVTQFATIIDCATGRSPILDYGNYGCYCGLGGKGEPLDATDECCMFHDRCYKQIVADRFCASDWSVKARWYSYRSDNCGTPQVAFTCKNPVNYKLFERVLSGANPQCAHAVCECDKAAAMCLKDAEFSPHLRMYNKLLMCGSKILNTLPEIIPRISPNADQPGVNNSLPTTGTSPNAGQPGVNNSLPTMPMRQPPAN